MLTIKNKIFKNGLITILILALILSGLFLYPIKSNAIIVEKIVTKYHLDMGAQHIWGTGTSVNTATWENGNHKGGSIDINTNLIFPTEVSNVRAYALKSSNFKWGETDYSYNETPYLHNQSDYNEYYEDYTSSSISNITCSSSGKTVNLSYTAILDSSVDFDLKQNLNAGNLSYILDMLGGAATVQARYPSTYDRLTEGAANGIGDNVYGFMYFTPVVIAYDVTEMVDIGELDAQLDLPSSAKQGESYTVSDATILSKHLMIETAVLEKHYGDAHWEPVITWTGSTLGQNTGGSIHENQGDICTVTYRLTVTTEDGQVDTDIKSINITDNREIHATAILELPEYTYEGHPALAVDISEFQVDGISYSARRAYEEGVATNSFSPVPASAGKATRESKTTAKVSFYKKGNYNVKLSINTLDGKTLTDTKPIEVRKTPYIIDRLGGFQKQNRKQLLNISVATYPDKPIVDYYISLKDLKTNQTITLTKEQPQENNATIKTRTHTENGDSYWTNFDLEFLTKNTDTQEYQYTIYVLDSKGDMDMIQKTFTVAQDLPPEVKISIQDTFIRKEGTNLAEIIADDCSITDGDQLERNWTVNGTNMKELPGYEDLSFGSGQKVKFNKIGVGEITIKLEGKDLWNEPTLEEYITENDYLKASTIATTEVINIAPTVRLEPIEIEKADLIILADKASKAGIEAGLNSLKAALIESRIDATIQVLPKAKSNSHGYRNVGHWVWPVSINCQTCQATGLVFDTEYAYKIESAGRTVSGYQEVCTPPHTVSALEPGEPLTGKESKIAWSYTVNESNHFSIQLDHQEQYVYLLCNDTNKTIILNRNNGALVTTLDLLIPGKPYIGTESNNLYFLTGDKISKFDVKTLNLTTVINKGGSQGRIQDGKITFVGSESSNRFYIGKFDLNTEQLDAVTLPELPQGIWTSGSKTGISPTDMDSEGKVTFTQTFNDSYNDTRGCFIWLVDSKMQRVKFIDRSGITWDMRMNSVGFVENEIGEGVYLYHGYCDDDSTTSTTRRYFTLQIYTLGDENTEPIPRTIYSQKNNRLNWNGISYAKLHSQENKIYIMQGADFGWNGLVQGVQCKISLPSWSTDFYQYGWGWDAAEEYGAWNDSLMATYYRADQWTGMTHRVKLFRNSITEEEAEKSALHRLGNMRYDAKKIIERDDIGDTEAFLLKINNILKEKVAVLELFGDDDKNQVSISKNILLDKGQKYQYEYDMVLTTGKALDIFRPYKEKATDEGMDGGVKVYSELIATRDYSVAEEVPFFSAGSSYYLNADYGYAGLGSGYYGKKSESKSYSCWLQVDMAQGGYVEFDFFRVVGYLSSGTYSIYLDGQVMETGSTSRVNHMLFLLEPGVHRFDFYGNNSGCIGLNNVKASYLHENDYEFQEADLNGTVAAGSTKTIQNTFISPRQEAFTKKPSDKGILMSETFQGGQVTLTDYISFVANNSNCPWGFNSVTGTASMGSGYYDRASGTMVVRAPADKLLVVTYDETLYSPQSIPGLEGNVKQIGLSTFVIPPGEMMQRSYTLTRGRDGYDKYGWVSISKVKIVAFTGADYNPDLVFLKGSFLTTSLNPGVENFAMLGFTEHGFTLTDYINIGGGETRRENDVTLTTKGAKEGIGAYISNFKLYRVVRNLKQLLLFDHFDLSTQILDSIASSTIWNRSAKGNGTAKNITLDKPEKEEDAPLIYKKGDLVAYHIFYDDYEKDPSKRQYWKYTHTPYNDGPHPDAAVVLDETGTVISSSGAILANAIPRFYIDGKYTVEHWQEDNTNRNDNSSGDTDYTKYDKVSNVESLTFYIEGGATAPWITSIKTIPSRVKEGDLFKLIVGVDDMEKDELRLTTELYKDKRLIYTHRKTGIIADSNGVYPYITTGYAPLAAPGKYEVVSTVRDEWGAGLGSYSFFVVSEGKITGSVNHTDLWNNNRKKYNLKRFSDEINRIMLIGDYLALSIPRQRGTNVFWSGEKFVLQSETEGNPLRVKTRILVYNAQGILTETDYFTSLTKTGEISSGGEELWRGALWDKSMINKWGRKVPMELIFLFSAEYESGKILEYQVPIIVDSQQDYWQLHRLW